MAFANLIKRTNCFSTCANETFFSFNETVLRSEAKTEFLESYALKTKKLDDFSSYVSIDLKLNHLLNGLEFIKNQAILGKIQYDKRITLKKVSKDESKQKSDKKKVEKTVDTRKSKKRSVQEISVIYEENESVEKFKSGNPDAKFQAQIKKIFKEKQAKILQKQGDSGTESEKLNLLQNDLTKKTSKKLRLSEEVDSDRDNKILRKSRKKSNGKTKKVKKLSLITTNAMRKKDEQISFIEQIEKLDKINGVEKNLKTSFKFTPTSKTICIAKIPAKSNTFNFSAKKTNVLSKSQTLKTETTDAKTKTNGLLSKPKNKVKELIEQFGDKFKKAASNLTKNTKKISLLRSSIGDRKAKLSLSKKEVKRRSIKPVKNFVKEIAKEMNKTTGQITSTNNSLINTSTQSQKLISAVKRNPLVVNHKVINNQLKMNNTKNTNAVKTPIKPKILVSQATIVKSTKPTPSNKKINPEDLKYDSIRCKQIIEMNQKKMAEERLKRLGSTSTISTLSSLNNSSASVSSLKYDMQSFKTVNTTFDSILKADQTTKMMQKNTTFCIKKTNTLVKQTTQVKPQVVNHNPKVKIEKVKNEPKTPKTIKKANVSNTTIVIKHPPKTPHSRSSSIDTSILGRAPSNYGIEDLKSCDETDDEDEPSKPIPEWAKNHNIHERTQQQARSFVNFTRLFKSSTNENIVLDEIFKVKKNRFYQRSSSAEWKTPTVWKTNGLNGDESFRRLHA